MKPELRHRLFLLAVMAPGLSVTAQAQERPVLMTVGLWTLGSRPFPGSDETQLTFKPIISMRRPDEREWLNLPGDHGGPAFFKSERFRFGPSINIVSARKEADFDSLKGLGDVDTAYEVGAFAEFWPGSFIRTRMEMRRGFKGHEGLVVDLSADAVWHANEKLRFTIGPRLSLANKDYMQT